MRGLDLAVLWRRRRWRFLLNVIDHLPRNSYYAQAVSQDEEHARMLLRHQEETGDDNAAAAPAMSTWTTEAAILADLVDSVRSLQATLIAVNSKHGRMPKVEPYTRPQTVMGKVRRADALARHEALADRMLPHRRHDA